MTRNWSANEVVDLEFNNNRDHRFYLKCNWGSSENRSLIFILLNPSVSDTTQCDPTISKCIEIANMNGFDCVEILNLFSVIEPDPQNLPNTISKLTEKDNKVWLEQIIQSAKDGSKKVVCAWGDKGFRYNANYEIFKLLEMYNINPYCLSTISYNQPGHPARKANSNLVLKSYNYSLY